MPQLDFTTYSSQIFWFLLCFTALYLCVSRMILPRISGILQNRKNIVDADLSSAAALDNKIHELQSKTENLRKDANQKYQIKLEEAAKNAAQSREKMIENLKEKLDQSTKKSFQELKDLIEQSHAQSKVAIQNLTSQITEKLLNN
jgi:F-type H+-transporting ATPase subunit b